MSIVISDSKYYEDISTKIRTILGTDAQYKPSEISQAILSMKNNDKIDDYSTLTNGTKYYSDHVEIVGSKMQVGALYRSPIKTFEVPENITTIPDYAFYKSDLENIILHDNITEFGKYSFAYCNLKSVYIPKSLKTIKFQALTHLYDIEEPLILPSSVSTIEDNAFIYSYFPAIDVPSSVTSVGYAAFYNCYRLKTLIIRASSVLGVDGHKTPLAYTDISREKGYIYVPSALVDSYKSNTYWSTYANQFRALEDYTVDGTVTGEFDFSKV